MVASLNDPLLYGGLAVDAAYAYFGETASMQPPSVIRRIGFGETQPSLLFRGDALVHDLAVDSTRIYFAEADLGLVAAIPREGGEPSTLAKGQESPAGVRVSHDAIYWQTSSKIIKLAK